MKTIHGDARQMDLERFERYQIIVADPPWKQNARNGRSTRFGKGADYEQMTNNEIAGMPVGLLATDRCHLYLWATMPLLPLALHVMENWSFEYCTVAFAWVKLNRGRAKMHPVAAAQKSPALSVTAFLDWLRWFGVGFYTASNIELVLLGRRGRPFKHGEGRKASQLVFAPHGEKHSQKPEAVQDRIEWMYPKATPRLELFGRRARAGWTVYGNDEALL